MTIIRTTILAPLFLSACLTLAGCSTWNKLNDTEKRAVIGGGTGAAVGDMVSFGIGGTVVGGAVGAVGSGAIGHKVERDKRRRNRY